MSEFNKFIPFGEYRTRLNQILGRAEISKDDQIKESLEAQGWQRAGQEHIYKTLYNPKTGRFERVKPLTEDEIGNKYLEQYGEDGFSEVRIEVSHEVHSDQPNESIVYVYMRRKEDIPEEGKDKTS